MRRYFNFFLIVAGLSFVLYWFYTTDGVESYVQNSDLQSFETRYTADDIIEMHKKELIGVSGRTFQEPVVQFHPYLLLNVKYYDKNHKTKQEDLAMRSTQVPPLLNSACSMR